MPGKVPSFGAENEGKTAKTEADEESNSAITLKEEEMADSALPRKLGKNLSMFLLSDEAAKHQGNERAKIAAANLFNTPLLSVKPPKKPI